MTNISHHDHRWTLLPLALLGLTRCSADDDRPSDALTFSTSVVDSGETQTGPETSSTQASEDGDLPGDGDGDPTGDGDGDGDPRGTPTEQALRVAFIGDQGLNSNASAVLDLVVSESAEFLIIAGDFDYNDDPTAWNNQNIASLGADYPVFAVAGNHDEAAFFGSGGYQEKIVERMQPAMIDGADCSGDLGLNSACTYKGLFMAFSGVDVYNGEAESTEYLRSQLANDDAIWSVCVWHKNMTDMQAGDKGDETGWGVYQSCQDEGAIIITGHEHSYSRTLSLTELGDEPAGHGAIGAPEIMTVGEGTTFVSVVGTGGQSLRDYHAELHSDDTWWSTIYTTNFYLRDRVIVDDFNPRQGALFIDFYVDGDPYKAYAYFKNIDGEIIDEYEIVRDPTMSGGDGDGDPTGGDGDGDDVPTLSIQTFADAYVDAEAPNQNFGSASDLLVDQAPVYESFLQPIGLDAIPAGTSITQATLRVYSHDAGDEAELRRVTQSWAEDTITYANRPSVGAVSSTFATTTGWIEIDVTPIVQAWVDGEPNYGVQLRSDGGNGSDYFASEAGFNGPQLQVWY